MFKLYYNKINDDQKLMITKPCTKNNLLVLKIEIVIKSGNKLLF